MPVYYIEFDKKVVDPEENFESSAFSRASNQLIAIAKELKILTHFDFFSFAAQNSLCPPEHRETLIPWHVAQVGIDWLDTMIEHIRSNPGSVMNSEELLADLSHCKDVLARAKATGAKWHFAMDI